MTIFGIDHAWGKPEVAALHRAGVKFVCRYLSHDTGKNLSRAEADRLTAAGIWIVVVWETTANRAISGHSGGVADAKEADRQARACGMPTGRPIYFAVDWDAAPGQQDEINAYLDGAATVLGRDRVGVYAGYWPLKRAFDAKKITFGWQTYAWSGGHWDARAQLQQYSNDHVVGGVDCDYNRAVHADYGQWQVGRTPGADPSPAPKPGTAAPPFPGRLLRVTSPEMHGADVLAWQRQMAHRGWNITTDSYYGPLSADICRAFQREKHLTADGIVGPVTWKATWESPVA